MAGTRTAPLVTAAANARRVTLYLMDASGDTWTEARYVAVAATAAALEAWAAAYQAATQSSLYWIDDVAIRSGDADPDNAETDQRNSVKDGINLSYKNVTTLDTNSSRLIAPIPAALQGNQDIPLLAGELAALAAAELAIMPGYTLQSLQYTERRERKNNAKIKA